MIIPNLTRPLPRAPAGWVLLSLVFGLAGYGLVSSLTLDPEGVITSYQSTTVIT